MQTSFNLSGATSIQLSMPGADVRYYPNWLSEQQASTLLHDLQHELNWRQDSIKLFGKSVPLPRLQAWYGAAHCAYGYSGLALTPQPYSKSLKLIANRLQCFLDAQFNCVLCNWYRDGNDSMSMHADDEPELGVRPTIASVTLGAARNFDFKHKTNGKKCRVLLEHGSLLVMAGATQSHYLHGISKSKRITEPRINLTYRYIAPNYEC